MKEKLKFSFLIFFILSGQLFPEIKLTEAFPNLNVTFSFPSDIQNAGDGTNRLFVTQNDGLVFVMPNDTNITAIKIFLDIRDRVANPSEGLLGMAFHPDYQNNGYFYLKYTCCSSLTCSSTIIYHCLRGLWVKPQLSSEKLCDINAVPGKKDMS